MSQTRTGANRRKLGRFPADIRVRMRPVSRLRRWLSAISARGVDFNRYGMGLVSGQRIAKGTLVTVDIEARHMILRGIRAQVVSCRRVDGQYRIGVRFYRRLSEFTEAPVGGHVSFLTGLEESLGPQKAG